MALTLSNQAPNQQTPPSPTSLEQSKSIAKEESFLHWEAAFPGVWRHWQNQTPEGGFDAVIGNPPWDRIKLQEVEWFATRDPHLARAPTAAARREGIRRLREQGDPLAAAFDQAKARADRLGSGHPRLRPLPPCSAAATSTSIPSSSNDPCASSNPAASSACSPPPASTPTRPPPASSSPSPPPAASPALYDFENRRLGTDLAALLSPTSTPASSSAPSSSAARERTFPETRCGFFLPDTRHHRRPRPSPSRWPLTTSPASTPTPVPPPSSAPAATPTSPAASTATIRSGGALWRTGTAASGPSATRPCFT